MVGMFVINRRAIVTLVSCARLVTVVNAIRKIVLSSSVGKRDAWILKPVPRHSHTRKVIQYDRAPTTAVKPCQFRSLFLLIATTSTLQANSMLSNTSQCPVLAQDAGKCKVLVFFA